MDFRLPSWTRPGLLVVLFACLLIFSGLNRFDLRDSVEPREAGVAADMLQKNQFLVPTLNGRAFLEKPPLSYWLQAASMKAFGYEPFAARLPSAFAGIATVLLFVFFFRHSERKDWLILLSGFFLLTMESFWAHARTAGQDMLLAFGVSLALLSFYFAREKHSRALWFMFAAGIAIATLTKGVVGLAVPGVVIFSYLLVETIFLDKRLSVHNWLQPLLFTLLGLLPILVWLWFLYRSQGFAAVKEVVWVNSVGRFDGGYAQGSHAEPFYFYLKKLPETFQPWSLFLYIAVWQSLKMLLKERRVLFFVCWILAPYILLSIAAGKRPSYLIMLYPAAAALLAHVVVSWAQQEAIATSSNFAKRLKWLVSIQAAMLSAATLLLVVRLVQVDTPAMAGLAAVLATPMLVIMWRSIPALRVFNFVASCAGAILVIYVTYYSAVVPSDDHDQSPRALMAKLADFAAEGRPVALYQPSERIEGATSFYLQRSLPVANTEAALEKLIADNADVVVLIMEQSPVDWSKFTNEARLKYGNLWYHYVSGKR
ncbi:MAG: hypothetical protein CRU78_05760 [Candidatus Accumulibacter phosphatis]|uniref:Glycosyltransferase RgtA/B/C/D-like domain-containing protein n=1 Tax=Candidatus Accumulibacter phosphatis TaxID=327160 RepID=A0A6A7RR73_9PROT|nr:hypothetical protein [Candidatus Accumulibacter phosphatis]